MAVALNYGHQICRPSGVDFPRFNTMVLWETHDATLHGLPDPVKCPLDRTRLSVACYYYTKARRVAAWGERRGSYWAARPGEDRAIEHINWRRTVCAQ